MLRIRVEKLLWLKTVPLLLFIALVGYVFWGPLLHPDKELAGVDFKLEHIHWGNAISYEIRSGRFPLWNPYIHGGYPFLAHPITAIFYPTTWLNVIFPPNWAITVSIVLHLIVSGYFMALLARRLTNDLFASLVAAVCYSFGGYMAGQVTAGHLGSAETAALLPLVVYTSYQAITTHKLSYVIAAMGSLALHLFIGFPENTSIMLLFLGLFVLLASLIRWQNEKGLQTRLRSLTAIWLPLGILMAVTLGGILLSAVQLLPSLEFFKATTRAQGMTYDQATLYSMVPQELSNLINPVKYLSLVQSASTYPFYEFLNYLGITTLGLALLAIIHYVSPATVLASLLTAMYITTASSYQVTLTQAGNSSFAYNQLGLLVIYGFLLAALWRFGRKNHRRSHPIILALALCALVGYILSFGKFLPFDLYHLLWQIIPIFRLFRIPTHYLIMTIVSVSLLAAFGLTLIRHTAAKVIITGIVVIEFMFFFKPFVFTDNQITMRTDPELVASFNTFDRNYRFFHSFGEFTTWDVLRNLYDPMAAMTYRIESLKGADPLILKSYADFASVIENRPIVPYSSCAMEACIGNYSSPLLDLLSVRYFMMFPWEADLAAENPQRFRLIKSSSQFRLYENLRAFPKGLLIYQIKPVDSLPQAASVLASVDFRPDKEIIMEKRYLQDVPVMPSASPVNTPVVFLKERIPNRSIFEVATSQPAMLLVTDNFYPGWKAKIDGRVSVPILPVDYTLRGIPVPAGNHTVTMFFAPDSLLWGALISGITAMGLAAIWLVKRGKLRS